MAWNPSPDIAALRDFSNRFNMPVVVAFSLHADGQRFQITSYGKTRKLCKAAASLGEQIAQAVARGDIEPPELEPAGQPPSVQTWIKQPPSEERP